MTEAEQAELNLRAKKIIEEFERSPQLQRQIIDELQADGIIDDRGQVICLQNGSHRESSVGDASK